MELYRKMVSFAVCGAFALTAVTLTGCPRVENGQAKVTTVLTTGGALKQALIEAMDKQGPVPVDAIERLTVTVTEVSLVPEDAEESEPESDKQPSSHVVVFSGALDLNLLDLTDLSEVLSTAEVPAGTYTQVRLSIENPRLVLSADTETELTNIQLTANGRLFVSESFELEGGESTLIVLDFGGIHLVQQGHGGFVLTPQLRAEISLVSAEVLAQGTILSVDTEAETFVLGLADGELEVHYGAAVIFLPSDTDTPTGTEADLAVGVQVDVAGLLAVDGTLNAETIYILAVP